MLKKISCIFLIFVCLFSFSISVFAVDDDNMLSYNYYDGNTYDIYLYISDEIKSQYNITGIVFRGVDSNNYAYLLIDDAYFYTAEEWNNIYVSGTCLSINRDSSIVKTVQDGRVCNYVELITSGTNGHLLSSVGIFSNSSKTSYFNYNGYECIPINFHKPALLKAEMSAGMMETLILTMKMIIPVGLVIFSALLVIFLVRYLIYRYK